MIDFHKIAQGLAENLCCRSTLDPSDTESLVREAFRRGLQLGLSMRAPDHLGRADSAKQCPRSPRAPVSTIH
jgi:hypothetical protein